MAIDPLQAFSPAVALFVPGAQKKNGTGTVSFDTLLSSLGGTGSSPKVTGEQANAELFSIEMMLNSLSLAGDGEASPAGGLTAFEAILAAPAQCCPASRAPASGLQSAPAAPAAPAAAAPPASGDTDTIGSTAAQYLGTPYRFGGEGGDGIDCSSFVQQVFREHQVSLPRTAREQSMVGSDVAPGDRLVGAGQPRNRGPSRPP